MSAVVVEVNVAGSLAGGLAPPTGCFSDWGKCRGEAGEDDEDGDSSDGLFPEHPCSFPETALCGLLGRGSTQPLNDR